MLIPDKAMAVVWLYVCQCQSDSINQQLLKICTNFHVHPREDCNDCSSWSFPFIQSGFHSSKALVCDQIESKLMTSVAVTVFVQRRSLANLIFLGQPQIPAMTLKLRYPHDNCQPSIYKRIMTDVRERLKNTSNWTWSHLCICFSRVMFENLHLA